MTEALERCDTQQRDCARARALVEQVCGDAADCPGRAMLAAVEERFEERSRKARLAKAREASRAAGEGRARAKTRSRKEARRWRRMNQRQRAQFMSERPLVGLERPPAAGTIVLYAADDGTVQPAAVVGVEGGVAQLRVGEARTEVRAPWARLFANDWEKWTPVRCRRPGAKRPKKGIVWFVAGEALLLKDSRAVTVFHCTDRRTLD